MDILASWLLPAALLALLVWMWEERRELRRRLRAIEDEMALGFRDAGRRFDEVSREMADQDKRMAALEEAVTDLPGRRDPGGHTTAGPAARPRTGTATRDETRARPMPASSVIERMDKWRPHDDGS